LTINSYAKHKSNVPFTLNSYAEHESNVPLTMNSHAEHNSNVPFTLTSYAEHKTNVLFTTKQQLRTQNNNIVDLFADNKSKEVLDGEVNPYWIDHDPEMKEGEVINLTENEKKFWNELIHKYLSVLPKDVKVSVILSAVHFPTLNMPNF
jgi:hypothetical protein